MKYLIQTLTKTSHFFLLLAALIFFSISLSSVSHSATADPIKPNIEDSSLVQPIKTSPTWVFFTEGDYEDVRDDLVLNIENQGLVISYTTHAADMFSRTSRATGHLVKVYKNAQSLFFCKAALSHKMVQADPHSLIFCPFIISVYELEKEPGKIYLSFLPPQKEVVGYDAIHQLLHEIVDETVSF